MQRQLRLLTMVQNIQDQSCKLLATHLYVCLLARNSRIQYHRIRTYIFSPDLAWLSRTSWKEYAPKRHKISRKEN